MSFVLGTWEDVGFRKVGPRIPGDADSEEAARQLAAAFTAAGTHEQAPDNGAVWIRDLARSKQGTVPKAVTVSTVIDAKTSNDLKRYGFVQHLAASKFADFPMDLDLNGVRRQAKLDSFAADPDKAKGVYDLLLALASVEFKDLEEFLRIKMLPLFFDAYPQGRVMFLTIDGSFETRQSLVRAGYTASQYGRLDRLKLNRDSFDSLRNWQPLSPMFQLRTVLELGAAAFFPSIQYFCNVRPGLATVFIPDSKVSYVSPMFPTSFLDPLRTRWDFAREQNKAVPLPLHGQPESYAAYRGYMQSPSFDGNDIENFVRWLVERFNILAFQQSDPAEFINNGFIDFVSCLEHGLSIDRIFRKGISCIASSETAVRKSAAMEIADIIQELSVYWNVTVNPKERFKTLFHPVQGRALMRKILQTIPKPVQGVLMDATDAVYDHLKSTIMGSIFVPAKIKANGNVTVRNKSGTGEAEVTPDDFTANVIRSLRNTHHGYLTKNDTQQRPSRYLALVTGNVPDTMPYLGLLFSVALLADSEALFGWRALPVKNW
ncbi:hypothetical protein GAY33_33720 [Azospirillum brasilense]|uniref:hypothetical protein n=1 Tax=Azospirillum argentinense TaxID=2970906 RepID=UPI00190EF16E|nr:hypothetical protein [Azospirillum argentinense]MBK3804040.1 hypothetical protein [Azospirillum argentinense]